jgi:hypothetical protein
MNIFAIYNNNMCTFKLICIILNLKKNHLFSKITNKHMHNKNVSVMSLMQSPSNVIIF